jgi:FMN phosphatase YigB (HAD superfamily)
MTVRAVFFDVGETLVDEERYWRALAAAAGLSPQVVWAALGKTIERPEASETLAYSTGDLHPDARACLGALRAAGLVVGIAGNQTAALEAWAREALPVDLVTSSASLGVRKPDPRFFEHLVDLVGGPSDEVAYVGDRADNDAGPAVEAGLVAFHLRRGPWGRLQKTPDGAIAIDSLAELPVLLSRSLVAEG